MCVATSITQCIYFSYSDDIHQCYLSTVDNDTSKLRTINLYNIHSHAGTMHIIVSYTIHCDVTMHYLLDGHTKIKKHQKTPKCQQILSESHHNVQTESENKQHRDVSKSLSC